MGLVRNLVLTMLVIPLIIVMAAKDPQAMGRIVDFVITAGAWLLNAVAEILNALVGGHS